MLKCGIFIVCVLLCGCTTYRVQVPSVSSYQEGVQIIDSAKPHSKVRLEIAQEKLGGANSIPFAFFVSAQNLSAQPVHFDQTCVEASQEGKPLHILSSNEVKESYLDYGFIVESYHLYVPPRPIVAENVFVPFVYRGYGAGAFFGDYWAISARGSLQQQIQLEDDRMKKAIIVSSYLQKNTLQSSQSPRGGFLLIKPSLIKPGDLEINVRVGQDIHHFVIKILSK